MNIYAILIECDPNNSLGGSCYRDLYNIANYLTKESINCKKIFLLTNKYTNKTKYPKICKYSIITNIKTQLNNIISEIPNNSKLLIYITGHGYQKYDKNKDEKDLLDEYIKVNNSVILDDDLRNIINKLDNSIEIIGIVDTCHSGSMFDLDYTFYNNNWILNNKNKKKLFINAFSLSACKDNELENCDIGNIGYGGALTIHLIDNNLLEKLLNPNINNLKYLLKKLKPILKKFNQEPIIQRSFKDRI